MSVRRTKQPGPIALGVLLALAACASGERREAPVTTPPPAAPPSTRSSALAERDASLDRVAFAESASLRVEAAGLDGPLADAVRPIGPRVRLCYEDARRAHAPAEAEISLSLVVVSGAPHARVAATGMKPDLDKSFVSCVLAALERVVFPPGTAGAAELSLRFALSGAPLEDTRQALLEEARAYGLERREKLASELPPDVQFIIRRSYDRIHRCFLEGLAALPKLAGTLRVAFEIGTDGQVEEARADGAIADPRVRACAATTFASLLFPARAGSAFRGARSFTFAPEWNPGSPRPAARAAPAA